MMSMPGSGLGANVYAITAKKLQNYFVKRINPHPRATEGTLG
jgi:hypothetical protein